LEDELITNFLSERDIKNWLSDITREKIIIGNHPRKRARLRCISEETIYEFLIERRFKKIKKIETRSDIMKFELHYNNPYKNKNEDLIIIIMPVDLNEKSLKVVTVILE